jgi:hypothetical protein
VLIASTVRRKPIEVWMLASFGFESLWPLRVRDVQRGEIICRWSTEVQCRIGVRSGCLGCRVAN